MTVVKTFVNESNSVGNTLEARVVRNPDNSHSIRHYVNDVFKAEIQFNESYTLSQLEAHAKSWLSEVKSLNG